MKKIGMQAWALICFLVLMISVSGAQEVGLRVDIPFNFNVAKKVLPAGHYLILAPSSELLKIVGPDGGTAIAITNRVRDRRPQGIGAVIFNCYGRRCFLSRFWIDGTESGQELLQGHLEREVAKETSQVAVLMLKGTPVDR